MSFFSLFTAGPLKPDDPLIPQIAWLIKQMETTTAGYLGNWLKGMQCEVPQGQKFFVVAGIHLKLLLKTTNSRDRDKIKVRLWESETSSSGVCHVKGKAIFRCTWRRNHAHKYWKWKTVDSKKCFMLPKVYEPGIREHFEISLNTADFGGLEIFQLYKPKTEEDRIATL